MYGRQQSGPALALELDDNATEVCRIRHAQRDFALYDIEIGVVIVRVLQHYVDNHFGRRYADWVVRMMPSGQASTCRDGAR